MGKWKTMGKKRQKVPPPRELYCMTLCRPKQHRGGQHCGLPDARLGKEGMEFNLRLEGIAGPQMRALNAIPRAEI